MIESYEWAGGEATITRMSPLNGVPLAESGPFDSRRVTGYQLLITTSEPGVLYIDPSNIIAPEDRNRIGLVRHNPSENKWESVVFTEESRRLRVEVPISGLYALTINVLSESRYVDDAVSTFPSWFAAVMDRNSNLRQLANIPASVFEDISEGLSEAKRRVVLQSIPAELIWRTFRYEMDGLDRIEDIVVEEEQQGQFISLTVSEQVEDLYFNTQTGLLLLDRNRAVLHRLDSENSIRVKGKLDGEPFEKTINGKWVKVFNAFDEFGLQFGLPRLEEEDNTNYRDRMRTLFTHPGNATKYGVLREIARRTGKFMTVRWVNTSQPFIVTNEEARTYCHEDVTVDGVVVEAEVMPDGGVMIPATNSMTVHEVVLHWGVEAYTLGRHRLDERGLAMKQDEESYEIWRQTAPILYGGIQFDRHEWDMVNQESLIEIMPPTDQKMEGWD